MPVSPWFSCWDELAASLQAAPAGGGPADGLVTALKAALGGPRGTGICKKRLAAWQIVETLCGTYAYSSAKIRISTNLDMEKGKQPGPGLRKLYQSAILFHQR